MVELKLQNPYIDEQGNIRENLEKHYAEDENGVQYCIVQVETGAEYTEAIDVLPCRYTYKVTDKPVVIEKDLKIGKERELLEEKKLLNIQE